MRMGHVLLLDKPLADKQALTLERLPNVICFAVAGRAWKGKAWPNYIQGLIKDPHDENEMSWALEQAKRIYELRYLSEELKIRLQIEKDRKEQITKSALQLASERDLSRLCEKTLTTLRHLTSAEGASLYIADPLRAELRFSHVQNEKIAVKFQEFRLPIDESSLVGAAAYRKEVIHVPDVNTIPSHETFRFNSEFDESTGYRTKSVLSIPLLKANSEVVGVVQLVNSKHREQFQKDDIELAKALSAHIAVALETALLYQDIEDLFEGFIRASVTAIESRDPTTSGHSERVADLTVRLAQCVTESDQKEFRPVRFNQVQLKELRYASLLHDFGKIGVPELVLVKEKKLYPHELKMIENRCQILRLAEPKKKAIIDRLWKAVLEANEPSVLVEEVKNDLRTYLGLELEVDDAKIPFLTDQEWRKLSVRKGSLSPEERLQIESHVTHTYKFLKQIPWTSDLKRVPEIAYSHHERLNGEGYPRRLKENEIPFESQIMAVADVFDALTAKDRPYKRSVPLPKALEILKMEASQLLLNPELVRLFEEQKVWEVIPHFSQ